MSKFVLIVSLEVKPEHIDEFIALAKGQAETSLRVEPGCHQFEIVASSEDPCKITHYEVFADEAAFDLHANSPHTAEFGGKIQAMLVNADMRKGNLVISCRK